MISGSVTPDGDPVLRVQLEGPEGRQTVEALVDTGFNGAITLPRDRIAALGLPERSVTEVTLADGRTRDVTMYAGAVSFGGQSRNVLVAESPTTPLLGTGLLQGWSLYVEFRVGGPVTVEELDA